MMRRTAILTVLAMLQLGGAMAQVPGPPTREATCTLTKIARLEHRLQSGMNGPFVAGSGSAVVYENRSYQVGYEELPQIGRSRVGDGITLCLIRLPRDCPRGDARGKVYTATNMRTLESWTLPDSEHGCGGA